MEPLVHPSELSVWHRFLQARRLYRETTRAKNPDWYRPALELETQLHLFVECGVVLTAALRRQSPDGVAWTSVEAPPLVDEDGSLENYLKEFQAQHLVRPVKSLGVVLHLADEFAISELAPFQEAPEDLGVVRDQLLFDPTKVLEDQSVSDEDLAFRLFPYAGPNTATVPGAAITISRQHAAFLRALRDFGERVKMPICTVALSAPLVALSSLPRIVKGAPERPFCVLFSYSDFSVLGFFTSEGNLLMLRSVRHHAGKVPANVDVTIQTMAVALELADPAVIVLALSNNAASETPRLANATVFDWSHHSGFDGDLPLEFQGAVAGPLEPGAHDGLGGSRTFQELEVNHWAIQDFLPPSIEEVDLIPGPLEMKFMRFGGTGIKVAAAVIVLFLLWSGVRVIQIMRDPAWHSKSVAGAAGSMQLLNSKIQRFEQWNTLLADRSKGWVAMELYSRLFPDPSAIMVKDANYVVRPDATRDKASVGLTRDWTINGFANEEARTRLSQINSREGMSKVFKEVMELTGDESMNPEFSTRILNVNLLVSENKRYSPDSGSTPESRFPSSFKLSISQQVTEDDQLAIPASAAP